MWNDKRTMWLAIFAVVIIVVIAVWMVLSGGTDETSEFENELPTPSETIEVREEAPTPVEETTTTFEEDTES